MSTAALPQKPRRLATPLARPPVAVVRTPTTPARAPFVIAVLILLSLGLGTLLLLNTLLAQGSFTLHSLDDRVAGLADREQALQQKASEMAAPRRLARQAQSLGMVPSVNPAFLRAADGKILGEPVPAAAPITPSPVVGSDDSGSATGTTEEPDRTDRGSGSAPKSDEKPASGRSTGSQTAGDSNQDGGNGSNNGGADR